MVDGEGPQVPEVDGGADRALKEPDDDDDADQAGQVARDGGARDAEHGDRPHAPMRTKLPAMFKRLMTIEMNIVCLVRPCARKKATKVRWMACRGMPIPMMRR